MGRRSTKLKNMTAEKAEARKVDAARKAVNDVGAGIGLPEIQRDPIRVEVIDAPSISGAGARADKTIRKLTRADMLYRSGAITKHHMQAIALYVDAAELAYGATVRATQYGEGGGSSPTGAASAAHSRQLDRANSASWYRAARATMPQVHVAAFEAIILDNQQIGTVGDQLYPTLSAGKISHNMRELVRTCADHLCGFFGIETTDARVHLAKTMARMNEAVKVARRPTSDAIAEVALRAAIEGATGIIIAPSVLADLVRENELDCEPGEFAGMPLLVNDAWQFGWVIQRAL